ncbi:MAG: glycoside hydrolase family 32 protein [Acidobacteria bacterium]|nr:glycoside hydrolase family 32 protein [Acidobacteriota bacterium]
MRKPLLGIGTLTATLLLVYGAGNYSEPYRPQYHFSPAKNWMNDPNGLVYYKGEYHLFYQYNPFGNTWGHMSWGHAVSRDLVHWEHLPVALQEEDGVMIYSGSAVVDWQNTSGLCRNPDVRDKSCLVAIYTGRTETSQTQHIAFSNDRGRTWTKFSGNPVIDLNMRDFRDPKVIWHEESKKWVMVTVLAKEKKVRFFGSSNLREWKALSDFGPEGATVGVWECPDLFPLPLEGTPGGKRWVLVVSLNPGGPAGGSGGQYFVGQFDGTKFVNENAAERVLWIDHGRDFYAVQSYSDIPPKDGRRIWIGWLTNWQYARQEPTSTWRTAQSIPRQVRLRNTPDGVRLVQEPVSELLRLREGAFRLNNRTVEETNKLLNTRSGAALEMIVDIALNGASRAGLKVRKGATEETLIGVTQNPPEVFVDRTKSGNISFHEKFTGIHAAPLRAGNTVRLHVFVDWSSVEVFANDGETVLSERIFPSPGSQGIELFAEGGHATVRSLQLWKLKGIWEGQVR